MEGGDGGIELPGHLADGSPLRGDHRRSPLGARRGADRLTEDRQQRPGHLARRQAEHEAGEDHPVDVGHAAGVGLDHPERAERAGARHGELDPAELGQQPASVAAVAPVGLAAFGDPLEMPIDGRGHAPLEQLGQGLAGSTAVVLAPFDVLSLHGLHHSERCW